MGSNPSQFRWRSFVTFALVLSSAVAAVSGVVLFVRPEGSLARWVGWLVLGLDKRQWETLHIGSVVLFLVLSPVHLWFNWRPLVAYLRSRVPGPSGWRLHPRKELAAALALVGLVVCGSLADWQPFSAVNDLRASIKDGKLVVRTPPPAANADKLTVEDLCGRLELDRQAAIANARGHGILIVDTSRTLADIASEFNLSPEAVYEAISGGGSSERDARP